MDFSETFNNGTKTLGRLEFLKVFIDFKDSNKGHPNKDSASSSLWPTLVSLLISHISFNAIFDDSHVKYETRKVINCGTRTTVFECVDRITGHRYALKIIPISKKDINDFADIELQEALKEVYFTLLLRSQVFAGFRECYSDVSNGLKHICIVTEFLPGGDLMSFIRRKGVLSEQQARFVFAHLMLCCIQMQRRKIVHRDIKPENILLCDANIVEKGIKLCDFGLATHFDSLNEKVCGTPLYVPPEALCSTAIDSEQANKYDVWSSGVVLFIMLCGFPPFWGRDLKELFQSVRSGVLPTSKPAWETLSPASKDLLSRCLTTSNEDRISASEALSHVWLS